MCLKFFGLFSASPKNFDGEKIEQPASSEEKRPKQGRKKSEQNKEEISDDSPSIEEQVKEADKEEDFYDGDGEFTMEESPDVRLEDLKEEIPESEVEAQDNLSRKSVYRPLAQVGEFLEDIDLNKEPEDAPENEPESEPLPEQAF